MQPERCSAPADQGSQNKENQSESLRYAKMFRRLILQVSVSPYCWSTRVGRSGIEKKPSRTLQDTGEPLADRMLCYEPASVLLTKPVFIPSDRVMNRTIASQRICTQPLLSRTGLDDWLRVSITTQNDQQI